MTSLYKYEPCCAFGLNVFLVWGNKTVAQKRDAKNLDVSHFPLTVTIRTPIFPLSESGQTPPRASVLGGGSDWSCHLLPGNWINSLFLLILNATPMSCSPYRGEYTLWGIHVGTTNGVDSASSQLISICTLPALEPVSNALRSSAVCPYSWDHYGLTFIVKSWNYRAH